MSMFSCDVVIKIMEKLNLTDLEFLMSRLFIPANHIVMYEQIHRFFSKNDNRIV